ncbi:unnamed protein product, partial [Ectocarpus fasciculatus]
PCADPANKNQNDEPDETPGAQAKRKDDAKRADDSSDATQGDADAKVAEANDRTGAGPTGAAELEEVLPIRGTKGHSGPNGAPAAVAEGHGGAQKDAQEEVVVPCEGARAKARVGDGASGGGGTRGEEDEERSPSAEDAAVCAGAATAVAAAAAAAVPADPTVADKDQLPHEATEGAAGGDTLDGVPAAAAVDRQDADRPPKRRVSPRAGSQPPTTTEPSSTGTRKTRRSVRSGTTLKNGPENGAQAYGSPSDHLDGGRGASSVDDGGDGGDPGATPVSPAKQTAGAGSEKAENAADAPKNGVVATTATTTTSHEKTAAVSPTSSPTAPSTASPTASSPCPTSTPERNANKARFGDKPEAQGQAAPAEEDAGMEAPPATSPPGPPTRARLRRAAAGVQSQPNEGSGSGKAAAAAPMVVLLEDGKTWDPFAGEETHRVAVWEPKSQRMIGGVSAPMRRELRAFLAEGKYEIYNGQDGKNTGPVTFSKTGTPSNDPRGRGRGRPPNSAAPAAVLFTSPCRDTTIGETNSSPSARLPNTRAGHHHQQQQRAPPW